MKVPINQKFIENTRVQRFLVANLFTDRGEESRIHASGYLKRICLSTDS